MKLYTNNTTLDPELLAYTGKTEKLLIEDENFDKLQIGKLNKLNLMLRKVFVPEEINEWGLVWFDDGAYVRDEALPHKEPVLFLPFNTHVWVHSEPEEGWYFIETKDGDSGFVQKKRVRTDLPDPRAFMYKIQAGETPEDIARKFNLHYQEWVSWKNFLLYLVEFNGGKGNSEKGLYTTSTSKSREDQVQSAKSREGYKIWLPSVFSYTKPITDLHSNYKERVSATEEILQLRTPVQKANKILDYLQEDKKDFAMGALRSAETTGEFIAIQDALEATMSMESFMALFDDWEQIVIASWGPLLGGDEGLNQKRADFIIDMNTRGLASFIPTIFSMYLFATMYLDDAEEVLQLLDDNNRLKSMVLDVPNVKAVVEQKGIDLDQYEGEGGTMARGAWEGLTGSFGNDEAKYYGWSYKAEWLPVEFQQALEGGRASVITSFYSNPLNYVDYILLNIPSMAVGLVQGAITGTGHLFQGEWEEAGRDLIGPAMVVLGALGARLMPRTIYGPKGPGQFVMKNYTGPASSRAAVGRLASVMQLSPRMAGQMGVLISLIGEKGVKQVAKYVNKSSKHTMFVFRNGIAGLQALHKAKGNLVTARSYLGQLPALPGAPPITPLATSVGARMLINPKKLVAVPFSTTGRVMMNPDKNLTPMPKDLAKEVAFSERIAADIGDDIVIATRSSQQAVDGMFRKSGIPLQLKQLDPTKNVPRSMVANINKAYDSAAGHQVGGGAGWKGVHVFVEAPGLTKAKALNRWKNNLSSPSTKFKADGTIDRIRVYCDDGPIDLPLTK